MLQKIQNQRVHILNLGFEYKWILDSFIKSRPDKVYIIKKPDEKNEKAIETETKIKQFLNKTKSDLKTIKFDEDIYTLVKILKDIIYKEKNNQIYLCISAGQRDNISAFILASMLFNRIPKEIYLYSAKDGDFIELPYFEVKLPKKEIIETIKFLATQEEGCIKKTIRDHLFDNEFLKIEKYKDQERKNKYKDKEHAKYVKLNRAVLDPAEKDWKLIEVKGKRKGSRITLTEEGKKWAKIF